MRRLLTATLLSLMSLPAFATYCADGNTIDMNECLTKRYKTADDELMKAYKNAMAFMGESRQELRYAQRAWITFRDKECNARTALYSGSINGIIHSRCMIDLTEERTEHLWENYRP